jgi:hypothetical protein
MPTKEQDINTAFSGLPQINRLYTQARLLSASAFGAETQNSRRRRRAYTQRHPSAFNFVKKGSPDTRGTPTRTPDTKVEPPGRDS